MILNISPYCEKRSRISSSSTSDGMGPTYIVLVITKRYNTMVNKVLINSKYCFIPLIKPFFKRESARGPGRAKGLRVDAAVGADGEYSCGG